MPGRFFVCIALLLAVSTAPALEYNDEHAEGSCQTDGSCDADGSGEEVAALDTNRTSRSAPPRPPAWDAPLPADGAIPAHIPVSMEPAALDFEAWPLCIPSVSSVEIVNARPGGGSAAELEIHSVRSVGPGSEHFHVTERNRTTLTAGGRVAVSIVFLPRVLGRVNGTLLVQTSAGGFLYALSGSGVQSPYQAEPLVATRVPAGTQFQPQLVVHNPHSEPLRIKEVYTSESFLRSAKHQGGTLAPPSGRDKGRHRACL
jgi:hypothetical protein